MRAFIQTRTEHEASGIRPIHPHVVLRQTIDRPVEAVHDLNSWWFGGLMVGWLVGCSIGGLVSLIVSWLVGWLVGGWLVRRLGSWVVGHLCH